MSRASMQRDGHITNCPANDCLVSSKNNYNFPLDARLPAAVHPIAPQRALRHPARCAGAGCASHACLLRHASPCAPDYQSARQPHPPHQSNARIHRLRLRQQPQPFSAVDRARQATHSPQFDSTNDAFDATIPSTKTSVEQPRAQIQSNALFQQQQARHVRHLAADARSMELEASSSIAHLIMTTRRRRVELSQSVLSVTDTADAGTFRR